MTINSDLLLNVLNILFSKENQQRNGRNVELKERFWKRR